MSQILEGAELFSHILAVSRRMSEERSLPPLLSYTMDEVLHLVGAERGFIVLKKLDGNLEFKVARDREGNDLKVGNDAISHSILEEITVTGESIVLSNAMTDSRFGKAYSVVQLRLRSIMCVPLKTKNNTIGAIYVENRSIRGRFRQEDVAPLELLAHQAAVAIENASLNDDLEVANRDLRELDELKNKFLFLVSHELNTPLTAVIGFTQILSRQIKKLGVGEENPVGRGCEQLENSVARLQKTISEILLAFRILSGQFYLTPYLTSVSPIVESTIREFASVCEKRNLTIDTKDIDTLPQLLIDSKQMKIVLTNVISNSIKYTPDGGTIKITGNQNKESVQLAIQDTGIGIAAEQQKRIFDFFHVAGSLSNHSTSKSAFRGGGLGLGLPIAKGIMNAFEGKIWVESDGQDSDAMPGTTCYISLPIG
ncbi:MAG: GAF domain-containing sensor histidine kinase [Chloroflexota bacterium]